MKMNVFYKVGFLMFLISVAMLIATTIYGYIVDDRVVTTILGVIGALIAVAGIIFVCVSKPKTTDEVNRQSKT